MVHESVAARYAQTLLEAAQAQARVEQTCEELALVARLLQEEPDAATLLLNPDVEAEEKVAVLDRALRGAWSELVRAFLRLVLSSGRVAFLPMIAEAFGLAVDRAQGRVRVTVRSAHPLSPQIVDRLRTTLEQLEHQEVLLRAELAPELLGGIQIRLDHRVIDGSVQRQLEELRQRLKAARVS